MNTTSTMATFSTTPTVTQSSFIFTILYLVIGSVIVCILIGLGIIIYNVFSMKKAKRRESKVHDEYPPPASDKPKEPPKHLVHMESLHAPSAQPALNDGSLGNLSSMSNLGSLPPSTVSTVPTLDINTSNTGIFVPFQPGQQGHGLIPLADSPPHSMGKRSDSSKSVDSTAAKLKLKQAKCAACGDITVCRKSDEEEDTFYCNQCWQIHMAQPKYKKATSTYLSAPGLCSVCRHQKSVLIPGEDGKMHCPDCYEKHVDLIRGGDTMRSDVSRSSTSRYFVQGLRQMVPQRYKAQ
eukprot:652871_1